MEDKRLLIIANPISGTQNKTAILQRAESELRSVGFDVKIALTHGPGHGAQLAAQAADEGYHGVVAAGGDGTVNEIGSALRGTATALGILPLGSGNGLARHIEETVDIDNALRVLKSDHIRDCDYGTVNDLPFFCTFGLGFDAAVSTRFAGQRRRGLPAYIQSVIREYVSFRPREFEITTSLGTTSIRAFVMTVANASQYGNNAYVAPGASIKDGLLDVTILHSGNPLVHAVEGIRLFTGRIDKGVFIHSFKTDRLLIKHEPGAAHIDGEAITLPAELDIKCHHGEIRIFTDPDHEPFKPMVTPMRSLRNDINYHLKQIIKQ